MLFFNNSTLFLMPSRYLRTRIYLECLVHLPLKVAKFLHLVTEHSWSWPHSVQSPLLLALFPHVSVEQIKTPEVCLLHVPFFDNAKLSHSDTEHLVLLGPACDKHIPSYCESFVQFPILHNRLHWPIFPPWSTHFPQLLWVIAKLIQPWTIHILSPFFRFWFMFCSWGCDQRKLLASLLHLSQSMWSIDEYLSGLADTGGDPFTAQRTSWCWVEQMLTPYSIFSPSRSMTE